MRNLEDIRNEERRSSVHLNMDTLEKIQPIINGKTLNHSTERRSRMSGVNCSFTSYYGRKSPVAKRRREEDKDDSKKMKTFDNDPRDDPSYETETLVLSEITEIVKEKEINEIIYKFSPIIRNFPEQIKKEMLESTVDLIERKNMFKGAIKYVIKGREDEPSKESELEELSIERLSEILIREIENRMPKNCRQCKMYYIVKPTDCPELHCMGCKVGMHDCTTMNEMKDRAGIKWLCETCEPIFNIHYLPKLDPIAIFEGFNLHVPTKRSTVTVIEKDEEGEVIQVETPTQTTPAVEIVDNPPPSIVQQIGTQPNAPEVAVHNNNQNNVSLYNISQDSVSQNNTSQNDITGTNHSVIPPPNQALNNNYKDVKIFPNMNKN